MINAFMKKSDNKIISKIIFLIIIALTFTSCSSKFVAIDNSICDYSTWNDSKTSVGLVALQRVYKKPVGIAKFPDGGQPTPVYSKMSIYVYHVDSSSLVKLLDLNGLTTDDYLPAKDNIRFHLILDDTYLYFNIASISNNRGMDELTKTKYSTEKAYAIDLKTKDIKEIDKALFLSKYNKNKKKNTISSNDLSKLLSDIPYSHWGVILKDIYPQSQQAYMEYIIQNKANKAILEQIIPTFTDKEKKDLIKKMIAKQRVLLHDYENTSKEDDVYQKSIKLSTYLTYKKYLKEIYQRLGFQSPTDNKVKNTQKALDDLVKYNIKIPKDFKLIGSDFFAEGYKMEFQLKDANSTNIQKYKLWFEDKVAYLLKNSWSLSKQTKFEKPKRNGIVTHSYVNFQTEHTELKYSTKNSVHFLELNISYDLNTHKKLNFTLSHEIEKH